MANDQSTTPRIEAFYDEFSGRFLGDIVEGNERVRRQLALLSNAIPANTRAVLVIGFGSGQVAMHVADVARRATVTAIDISSENVRMAQALFAHPRVSYRKLDITSETIQGEYDVIVLPDVYEHIPVDARPGLHGQLSRLLGPGGCIVLTLPSPAHQDALREQGQGLQVVDETITLADLMSLARDVGASLTYFNSISVWRTNDYLHAILERGAERERPIAEGDQISLKGVSRSSRWRLAWRLLCRSTRVTQLLRSWKRRQLEHRLSRGSRVP